MAIIYTENLIPIMTSNTSPSGIASASSIFNATYDSYYAFNKINNLDLEGWITPVGNTAGWLSYEFTTSKSVFKYSIVPLGTPYIATAPKDWTFEGWNGSSWIVLDTRTSITNWTGLTKKEFTFNNYSSYIKYRINISANNGGTNTGIAEIEMFGIKDKYLIKQNNNYYTINSSNYDSATTHNFIPLTLTGGIIPNKNDIDTFGFEDLNLLTNSIVIGSDTFIPINKFDNTAKLKLYKG